MILFLILLLAFSCRIINISNYIENNTVEKIADCGIYKKFIFININSLNLSKYIFADFEVNPQINMNLVIIREIIQEL